MEGFYRMECRVRKFLGEREGKDCFSHGHMLLGERAEAASLWGGGAMAKAQATNYLIMVTTKFRTAQGGLTSVTLGIDSVNLA